MKLVPTLVRLSPELKAAVEAKAAAEDRSFASAVRRALAQYVEAPKP